MARVHMAFASCSQWHDEEYNNTSEPVRMLISAAYCPAAIVRVSKFKHHPDWILDSGAFSVHTLGATIPLERYIKFVKHDLPRSPLGSPSEVFSLDVISNWQEGKRNVERMWKAGVEAIPCFHLGEPVDLLKGYAKDYPKVAIGDLVGSSEKVKSDFCALVFDAVGDKRIHGFALTGKRVLQRYPFDSVDSSTWTKAPRYGSHEGFPSGLKVPPKKIRVGTALENGLRLERESESIHKAYLAKVRAEGGV